MTETLAFRVWMNNGSLTDANVGGLRSAPPLVTLAAVTAQSHLDWQEILLGKLDQAVYVAMFLLFAVLAASLVLFDRSDRVYLWVAATMLISTVGYVVSNISALTERLDSRIADQFMAIDLQTSAWVMVW